MVLNTWEACYFAINHESVIQLAKRGNDVGADLLVLDDGWFMNRNDDTTSLGDWIPCAEKFPRGLKALTDEVNELGMRFGIWLEPEMVSRESSLYRDHPEWVLSVPGRPIQLGRNQMVLDFSRAAVVDHVFQVLSNLLNSCNIEYVKWDMNRPLTEVHSHRAMEGGPPVEQSETGHRFVLGLYALLRRLTAAFPHILFETCSSGGGRFDPGMLYFSPQIWCSDNTDAVVRMKIQYGTSMVYPICTMGSHISSVPNHITGNTTRSRTRGFVAMCGTFGFEIDFLNVSQIDVYRYKKQVLIYRKIAPVISHGDLYRLWNPFKCSYASWMFVSSDKKEAVIFVFSVNSDHWSNFVPRLYPQGLDCSIIYEVSEPLPNNLTQNATNLRIQETSRAVFQLGRDKVYMSGDILMSAGLPIKLYTLDDSVMFHLRKINDH